MSAERPQILVVDDEPAIRSVVLRTLGDAGYDVNAVSDRAGAIRALAERPYDLAILDVQLPDANGLDLCEELLARHRIQVIMLTVVVDESDIVRALEAGAEDYVRKPFGTRELTARVASVLRRGRHDGQKSTIEAGPLRLEPGSYRAQLGEATLALTPTEYRLLAFLVRNAGRVATHDELLRHVWGAEYAGEHHMLHVTMSRLRQKLNKFDDGVNIRTAPGIGYEFMAPY
jgi:DNA-binding response OmpR family regulator